MRQSAMIPVMLILLLPALIAGTTSHGWPPQEKLPEAAAILDRFVEVTGGAAAYEKLQNQVITGTVEFVDAGIKGTTIEYRAAPAKVYRAVDIPGVGKIEAGTDGSIAWELSSETGPRIKTGEEAAAALREANFNVPLHWRDIYKRAENVAREMVDNEPSFKVVLTPGTGKPVTHYYSETSGLLTRIVMSSITPTMGEVATVTSVSEYRSEGTILVAHRLRRKLLSQQIDTRIDRVEFNVAMPQDPFVLPAAIRSLLVKKPPAPQAEGTGMEPGR
jgi:hypothetical protein